jgi:plasmid stabilization system protein ParE
MTYRVVFAPEAQAQLIDLFRYVADRASGETARRYVDAIVTTCENLRHFPLRGTRRDDIRRGLRTTPYKKRVVIAYHVDESARRVAILGVFYGGRDYESMLRLNDPREDS